MNPTTISRRGFLRRVAIATGGLAVAPAVPLPRRPPVFRSPTASLEPDPSVVPPPQIVTRAQWGADESRRRTTPTFQPVRTLVVHHTVTINTDDPATDVREVYRLHLARDGGRWGDIGYHFLISPQGSVYEGRWARDYSPGELHDGHDLDDRVVRGIHAEGANDGTIGVALLGDFRFERPALTGLIGLVHLCAWLCDRHALDPLRDKWDQDASGTWVGPSIVGHRDVTGGTVCPGWAVADLVPDLRRWVAERLAAPVL